MFMMFHAPEKRRPLLIALFGAALAIGIALMLVF